MIKKLDKENLPILRSEIDIALQPIADKYGIKLSAGNASFSEFSATFKLEVATAQDGNFITKEGQNFLNHAKYLGLSEDFLNKEFDWFGSKYILTGYKPRSSKYPFIANKISDGRSYKLPKTAVKAEYFKELV
jgi:hypothetical protein